MDRHVIGWGMIVAGAFLILSQPPTSDGQSLLLPGGIILGGLLVLGSK